MLTEGYEITDRIARVDLARAADFFVGVFVHFSPVGDPAGETADREEHCKHQHGFASGRRNQVLLVFQNISGLAFEGFADCLESGEPNRFCFAVFQDGNVGHRDANFFGQLGDAHLPLSQHDVDIDGDAHAGLVRR